MKMTRREFIQAAGAVAGAVVVHADPSFAVGGGAMQSPAINPVYLTGSLDNWPLAELSSMGYKGLEITPVCLDNISSWKTAADSAKLPAVCVNALPELTPYLTGNLHDGVERGRRATIDRLLGILKIMNTEGIPFLVVASGRLAENYQTPVQARALFVSSLKELSAAAKDATILIESVPGRLFVKTTEIVTLLSEVNSPNLAAAIDIGHVMQCGATPMDAAGKLGNYLRYVQIHDADQRPGYPRLDRHIPMGQGSAKREDSKGLPAGLPLAVNITAPDNPLAAAKDAIAWIRS